MKFNTQKRYINEEVIYHKEIEEIKKIYSEIIKNITKINKIFGLTNPVEIYALFTCELSNGYLSNNKHFEYIPSDIKNIRTLYGANPITGKSVCRHIAAMLRDIMKSSGIKSNTVNVYMDDSNKKKKNKIEKKYGNHVITLAISNGEIHLLDSTLQKIYKPQKRKYIIDSNSEIIKTCIKRCTFSGTKEELKKQKKYIKLPSTTFEEDKKQIEKVESIFKNNLDILEILYNSNKDLYKEVSQKILLFRK